MKGEDTVTKRKSYLLCMVLCHMVPSERSQPHHKIKKINPRFYSVGGNGDGFGVAHVLVYTVSVSCQWHSDLGSFF